MLQASALSAALPRRCTEAARPQPAAGQSTPGETGATDAGQPAEVPLNPVQPDTSGEATPASPPGTPAVVPAPAAPGNVTVTPATGVAPEVAAAVGGGAAPSQAAPSPAPVPAGVIPEPGEEVESEWDEDEDPESAEVNRIIEADKARERTAQTSTPAAAGQAEAAALQSAAPAPEQQVSGTAPAAPAAPVSETPAPEPLGTQPGIPEPSEPVPGTEIPVPEVLTPEPLPEVAAPEEAAPAPVVSPPPVQVRSPEEIDALLSGTARVAAGPRPDVAAFAAEEEFFDDPEEIGAEEEFAPVAAPGIRTQAQIDALLRGETLAPPAATALVVPAVAQEPVQRVSPPKAEVVKRKAERAVEAAPVAQKTAPVRMMEEELRTKLASHLSAGSPGMETIISRVASHAMSGMKKGEAPAAAVRKRSTQAVETVRKAMERAHEIEAAKVEAEKGKVLEGIEKQAALAKELRTTGAPQERARTTEKKEGTAEETASKSRWHKTRLIKKEMKKPEAERNPVIVRYAEKLAEREAIKKSRGTKSEAYKEAGKELEAIWGERVEAKRAEEKVALPAPEKPKALPEPGKPTGTAVAEVKPGTTEVDVSDFTKAQKAIASVTDVPDVNRLTMKTIDKEAKNYASKLANAAGALADRRPSSKLSVEENFLILARKVASGKEDPGAIFAGVFELRERNNESMVSLASTEQMEGTAGAGGGSAIEALGTETLTKAKPPSRHFMAYRAKRPVGGPIVVKGPVGTDVEVTPIYTTTASQLIQQVNKDVRELDRAIGFGNFMPFLQKMHSKVLRQLVGDMDVHFFPAEQADYMGVTAFYNNPYTTKEKAGVYINEDWWNNNSTAQERQHILEHELTHAATAYAHRQQPAWHPRHPAEDVQQPSHPDGRGGMEDLRAWLARQRPRAGRRGVLQP